MQFKFLIIQQKYRMCNSVSLTVFHLLISLAACSPNPCYNDLDICVAIVTGYMCGRYALYGPNLLLCIYMF